MISSVTKKKVKQFQDFLMNLDGTFANLNVSITMKERLKSLIGESNSKIVLPVVSHSSGSIIGLINYEKNDQTYVESVIWLDSEGWPKCIFANNFDSFLKLLPYGTENIYDMIASILFWSENPNESKDPKDKFKNDFLLNILKERKNNIKHQFAYLEWLSNIMQLKTDDNPLITVQDAIKKYSSLNID